ncbi:MAG: hypothetical protein ACPLSM_02825 [Thermosphaera sp.]
MEALVNYVVDSHRILLMITQVYAAMIALNIDNTVAKNLNCPCFT